MTSVCVCVYLVKLPAEKEKTASNVNNCDRMCVYLYLFMYLSVRVLFL